MIGQRLPMLNMWHGKPFPKGRNANELTPECALDG
jgi:hypothetical protein